jgi:hypothetical protein
MFDGASVRTLSALVCRVWSPSSQASSSPVKAPAVVVVAAAVVLARLLGLGVEAAVEVAD